MLLGKEQLSCFKLKKLKFPCSWSPLSMAFQLKEQVGSVEVLERTEKSEFQAGWRAGAATFSCHLGLGSSL